MPFQTRSAVFHKVNLSEIETTKIEGCSRPQVQCNFQICNLMQRSSIQSSIYDAFTCPSRCGSHVLEWEKPNVRHQNMQPSTLLLRQTALSLTQHSNHTQNSLRVCYECEYVLLNLWICCLLYRATIFDQDDTPGRDFHITSLVEYMTKWSSSRSNTIVAGPGRSPGKFLV